MNKTIKSLLSFLVAIVLAVSSFAFSASAASVTISGAGEYEVGKTFSVNIRFSADATLYAVEADVSYNSSVLRLNSVSGADYNIGNGSVKIVDDGFSATNPSKNSSYTLNFTAIAAGNSNITASLLGGGEAESKASESISVTVITPKPSSNANLSSIRLSSGALSPAFNPNTTEYDVTVKYGVESITISGAVADGKSTYNGGGTFDLEVGDQNECVLMVTAEDGTKKAYTINIKRMTEEETLQYEQDLRDSNPLLVIIGNNDYTIVNDIDDAIVPTGFTKETATRKEQEITVLNSADGKYQLCWLVDAEGENGAFYRRDENDNFTKLAYINVNDIMYIIENIDKDIDIPSGYQLVNYEIDGQMVDAIQREGEDCKEFYIFNCYVAGQTENKLYQYDIAEGTIQRAVDFYAALSGNSQEIVVGGNTNTNISSQSDSWFGSMNKTGKLVFFGIVAIGVLIVVIAILLIVKISSSKDDDYSDDDGYGTSSNEDYIFGDTEEIFPFPVQKEEQQEIAATEQLSDAEECVQPEKTSDTSVEE